MIDVTKESNQMNESNNQSSSSSSSSIVRSCTYIVSAITIIHQVCSFLSMRGVAG
jgi:hypothetical protein